MSQEWKLVPVEPTQSMLDGMITERKKGNGVLQMWFEALAAAPTPPSFIACHVDESCGQGGGEVEVFAYYLHPLGDLEHGRFLRREDAKIADPSKSDHHGTVVLVDRNHVTRLQAENAALQQRLNTADQRVDELQSESFECLYNAAIEERDAAQSELATAIAWLKHAKPLLHSGGFNLAASDIGNFLADQSAPAAKDGA